MVNSIIQSIIGTAIKETFNKNQIGGSDDLATRQLPSTPDEHPYEYEDPDDLNLNPKPNSNPTYDLASQERVTQAFAESATSATSSELPEKSKPTEKKPDQLPWPIVALLCFFIFVIQIGIISFFQNGSFRNKCSDGTTAPATEEEKTQELNRFRSFSLLFIIIINIINYILVVNYYNQFKDLPRTTGIFAVCLIFCIGLTVLNGIYLHKILNSNETITLIEFLSPPPPATNSSSS